MHQNTLEEINGKTVKNAISWLGESVCILFEDGSYIKFKAEHSWECTVDLNEAIIEDHEKRELGIITPEQYTKLQQDKYNARQEQQQRDKLAQYERLKQELGK